MGVFGVSCRISKWGREFKMKNKIVTFLSSLTIQVICRLILGGLFIYAGIPKVADPHGFAKIIANYHLLPDILVSLPAIILPWLEIITGFFLVVGIFKRTSAIVLSSLLVVFICAIGFNLIRGLNFDCGCFSTIATKTGSNPVGLLIRDFFTLIPGLIIIFFYKEKSAASTQAVK
jgi:putative oxidoreductase